MEKKKVAVIYFAAIIAALGGMGFELKSFSEVKKQVETTISGNVVVEENDMEEKGKKIAYLTFDDGPSCLTSKYLDVLEEEGVQATFFVIGQQIDSDAEQIIKREIEGGNEIGIHTYCHEASQIYTSADTYMEDVNKVKNLLKEKFSYEAKLVRFPWGSANDYISSYRDQVIKELKDSGLQYQDWNVSAEDSVGNPTVSSILTNIRKDYDKYNEPVILMHDSGCNNKTLEALKTIIQELKNDGYEFGTLSGRTSPCHFYEYE